MKEEANWKESARKKRRIQGERGGGNMRTSGGGPKRIVTVLNSSFK